MNISPKRFNPSRIKHPALCALFFCSSTVVASDNQYTDWLSMLEPTPLPVQALYQQYFEWLESPTAIGAISDVTATHRHPYLGKTDFSTQAKPFDALYQLSKGRLLWVQGQALNTPALAAMALLQGAAANGLNPNDYDVDKLAAKQPRPGQHYSLQHMALFDSALSIALLRYMSDLHEGRVNPEKLQFKFKPKDKEDAPDYAQWLFAAAQQGNFATLVAKIEPDSPTYRGLKKLLPTYRELAKTRQFAHFDFGKKLSPGQSHPQIPALREYLRAVGDLQDNGESQDNGTSYSGAVLAAMKSFQQRHGFEGDGVIGAKTTAALNVPMWQRVQQIELSMERLRWLPKLDDRPYLMVNIPSFRLWGYDSPTQGGSHALTMKVVVGQAAKTQTPVFMADMHFVDFHPYWNVPYSILKNEILPKLMQDPGFLDRQNMEVVGRYGDSHASGLSGDSYYLLKTGAQHIRQRPGKGNALGTVKFVFPNENGVYMHDTPSQQFFARTRRDFSHGCIRVAEPGNLAEFVLKFQEGWGRENIDKALQSIGKSQRVKLKGSIPVIIFYTTAMSDEGGNAMFFEDIYGHDERLAAALSKKPQRPATKHLPLQYLADAGP